MDPGCLSRIRIFFHPSQIPDPTTTKSKKNKEISFFTLLCSRKFHRIENYYNFLTSSEQDLSQKNLTIFTQKLLLSSQKYGFNQGSKIRKNLYLIPDSEVSSFAGIRPKI